MRSNSEFMAQAIAAIPLWRAFLDKKEAEQDALLAEVLADKPKPTLLSGLTARFSRRNTAQGVDQSAIEQPIPIIEEAITDEDEKMLPFPSDDASGLRGEEQKAVTAPDKVRSRKVETKKEDDQSEREVALSEHTGFVVLRKKEVVSSDDDDNETPNDKQGLGDGNHKDEASQFQDIFN